MRAALLGSLLGSATGFYPALRAPGTDVQIFLSCEWPRRHHQRTEVGKRLREAYCAVVAGG